MTRVLIAAPIADFKEYSLPVWAEYLEREYPTTDVMLCVNGRRASERARELSEEYPRFGFIANDYDGSETMLRRLYEARQSLQEYARENGYGAIWWLDTDTIPQIHHALERLLAEPHPIVSGVYCYKKSSVPVILNTTGEQNVTLAELQECFMQEKLYMSAGTGFGCLLVRDEYFDVPFDQKYIKDGISDDFAWYAEMQKMRGASPENLIVQWAVVVPIVLCKHLGSDVTNSKKEEGRS